jgi:hypothetical protein
MGQDTDGHWDMAQGVQCRQGGGGRARDCWVSLVAQRAELSVYERKVAAGAVRSRGLTHAGGGARARWRAVAIIVTHHARGGSPVLDRCRCCARVGRGRGHGTFVLCAGARIVAPQGVGGRGRGGKTTPSLIISQWRFATSRVRSDWSKIFSEARVSPFLFCTLDREASTWTAPTPGHRRGRQEGRTRLREGGRGRGEIKTKPRGRDWGRGRGESESVLRNAQKLPRCWPPRCHSSLERW